jgi:UDP:flavonoid glycosyltransferase YjiC (YdhE family)
MCLESLAPDEWHVVLSVGDMNELSELQPLPAHAEIVRKTSHISILPHASLYIFLGGIISTTEALYHGVPLVALSAGNYELELLGRNIERLGIGAHLMRDETSSNSIRDAVERALSATVGDTIQKLRKVVLGEPGGEETANAIEEYLESGR